MSDNLPKLKDLHRHALNQTGYGKDAINVIDSLNLTLEKTETKYQHEYEDAVKQFQRAEEAEARIEVLNTEIERLNRRDLEKSAALANQILENDRLRALIETRDEQWRAAAKKYDNKNREKNDS